MRSTASWLFFTLVVATSLSHSCFAQDTDDDGLVDVIDVEGSILPNGLWDFDDRGIQDLDGVTLLSDVRRLRLRQNQIASIESGDFLGLDELVNLQLSSNSIVRIESGAFAGLGNLTNLELYANQLTSIRAGDFVDLPNLRTLQLSWNELTSIDDESFAGLSNLASLTLDGNQLTTLEGHFAGLTNLRLLTLGGNLLTRIDAETFAGLDELEILQLSNNPLTEIKDGAFAGLNLETLSLEQTSLTELNFTGATFDRMLSCHHLDVGVPTGMVPPSWGLCVTFGSVSPPIRSIVLDEATLVDSAIWAIRDAAFQIARNGAHPMEELSLVGLKFSSGRPKDMSDFLGIWFPELDHVTVDQLLFDLYADEFMAFDEVEGHTVTVVEGNGNRFVCDADIDGDCDFDDLNAMYGAAGPDTQFDYNGDGSVDVDDIEGWLEEASSSANRTNPEGLALEFGDVNLDGGVDSHDLGLLLGNFGATAATPLDGVGWRGGDLTMDGAVNSWDLGLLLNNFESTENVAAVPEPKATGWLLGAACLMCAVRRIRRNSR